MPSGFEAASTDHTSLQVFSCDAAHIRNTESQDTFIGNNSRQNSSNESAAESAAPIPARPPVACERAPVVDCTPAAAKSCSSHPAHTWETNRHPATADKPKPAKALHRIAEIRKQQGISERTVAKRLNVDVKRYREMEDPNYDLSLSELHALQGALEVPLVDLLEDRNTLSRPVEERAKLVKIMKTAVAMREAQVNPRVTRMAEMLCEQLADLMPELAEVSGWPQFGARRGASAIGKALQQPIDTSQLGLSD